MALPVFVFVAQELANYQGTIVAACSHAVRPAICEVTSDRSEAFAIVEHAGVERYRIVVRGQPPTPLTFSVNDDPEDRARSLGITLGVLALAARGERPPSDVGAPASKDANTSSSEAASATGQASSAAPPRSSTQAPPTNPEDTEETVDLAIPAVATGDVPGDDSSSQESNERVVVHALITGALGNGILSLRAGAQATLGVSHSSLPLGGFVMLRSLWGAGEPVNGVRSRWLAFGAGLFYEALVAPFRIDVRLGYLQESWVTAQQRPSESEQSEERSYGAVMGGMGLSLPVVDAIGVRLGGSVSTSPGQELYVQERRVGDNPPAAGCAELGVAGVF